MNYLDKILKKAEVEHDKLKHPYVGTEHLLLAILSEENELTEKLKEYNLTYNKFKRKLKDIVGEGTKKSAFILYTPMLRNVLSNIDREENVDCETLFKSLIDINEGIAIRIIESMNIDINLIDLNSNNVVSINDYPIEHREKEINEVLQILMRKNKCNPLLIGGAGVGKTAIVEEIQRRLELNDVPDILKGYKIVNVDMSSLVAGTKYRGDFENKINNLLSSVKNSKKILFIDEIHTLVHAGGAEGAISAGDIIKPYLSRGVIKCIGATTVNEYHEFFKCDEALNRRFQTVYINEPSIKCTIDILNKIKYSYEKYHKVFIDESIIKKIVHFSHKYILNKYNPDKSIELLDSCCSNALLLNNKNVTLLNLYNVIENRYGINLNNNFISTLLNNKSIVLSSLDNLDRLMNNYDVVIIDGNKFKCDEDLYKLLGNPVYKNSNYILKDILEKPMGYLLLINCNYNQILKESIFKILNYRHIYDNYGNSICLDNYIIIAEKNENESTLGFAINNDKNINYIEFDEKLLLTI